MKRSVLIVSLPLLGALSAGCVVRARAGVTSDPAPPVFVEPPTLVAVDSGVWVVRDADYPVYYVDDEYWVVRDGVWYRSRYYDRDWVTVQPTVVPAPIVRRDHNVYVHFRGEAGAQTRVAPRAHEVVEPSQVAPAAAPVVRSEAPPAPHGRAEEPRTQVRPDERRPSPPAPIPARRVEDERPPAVKHDERRQGAPAPRPARRIDEEKQADPNQREKSAGKKP
jgi:hypothetical protein